VQKEEPFEIHGADACGHFVSEGRETRFIYEHNGVGPATAGRAPYLRALSTGFAGQDQKLGRTMVCCKKDNLTNIRHFDDHS